MNWPVPDKFSFPAEENELSRILKSKKRNHQKIIDLTISSPYRGGLDFREYLPKIPITEEYFPDPKGESNLLHSILLDYHSHGRSVEPDSIFLTSGTSESISVLIKLFTNPGDEAILLSPGYPLFEELLNWESIRVKKLDMEFQPGIKSFWRINIPSLEKAITSKTKLFFLVQPNNPTGMTLNPDNKREVEMLLEKHGILIVLDEVFSDYNHTNKSYPEEWDVNSIYLNGISKKFGLPGWKLGWFYIKWKEKKDKSVLDRMEHILDTYLNVSYPIQLAGSQLFQFREAIQSRLRNRLQTNLDRLRNELKDESIRPFFPDFGWYIPLKVETGFSTERLAEFLLYHEDIYLYPGEFFGFKEKFFVISLLSNEEDLQSSIVKIKNLFNQKL